MVGTDVAKHHALCEKFPLTSHMRLPAIHNTARSRSAMDSTNIGKTCHKMNDEIHDSLMVSS